MSKHNDINHIMRNGLVNLQIKARMIARQADDILRVCKEMEGHLKELTDPEPVTGLYPYRNDSNTTGNERPFPV